MADDDVKGVIDDEEKEKKTRKVEIAASLNAFNRSIRVV